MSDGSVLWILDDVRDGTPIGRIALDYVKRPGYVKANGALLQNASVNYPRLVAFATDNHLTVADDAAWEGNKAAYVYDDVNDTLRVPDATGRVLQGGSVAGIVEAGLPNITGWHSWLADNSYGALGVFGKDRTSNNVSSVFTKSGIDRLTFDASKSSSIYGSSTTVQPPALVQIAQIRY